MTRHASKKLLVSAAPLLLLGLGLGLWPGEAAARYASCVACHALPLARAEGVMGAHALFAPPQAPEASCGACHAAAPHAVVQDNPYLWNWPLDPYAYPPGPSVGRQMCDDCHGAGSGFDPNLHHPNDRIPFPYGTAPPALLPLFDGGGAFHQDPGLGGVVCATCHDPHDASVPRTGGGTAFLRAECEQASTLCLLCHSGLEPEVRGHDLAVGTGTGAVTVTGGPAPAQYLVRALISNRGNGAFPGGWMDVAVEAEDAGRVSLAPVALPSLAAGQEAAVTFLWDATQWTGDAVLSLRLPASQLSPARATEYVKQAWPLPPPANLRVARVSDGEVEIAWDPASTLAGPVTWNVYRNYELLTPIPVSSPGFTDSGLAPGTPCVYTVEAVNGTAPLSPMSSRVSALTPVAAVLRVPEEYATIQQAVAAAPSGTSIHVGPGFYEGPVSLAGKERISIRGADANACFLALSSGSGTCVDLDGQGGNNTLSGFTILGGSVSMGAGDTLSSCVLSMTLHPGVLGAGFVTNCLFHGPTEGAICRPRSLDALLVTNSIFMTPASIVVGPEPAVVVLLHNDFVFGLPTEHIREGNFSADPKLAAEASRVLSPDSPCVDAGTDVGVPFTGSAPDVGPLETGVPYHALPPYGLSGSWVGHSPPVTLTWLPSYDDGVLVQEYWLYRSPADAAPAMEPLARVPRGTTSFEDWTAVPEQSYVYEISAFSGPGPGGTPLLSAPMPPAAVDTRNRLPTAAADAADTLEDTPVTVSVLANDLDPDGDALTVAGVGQPSHGTASANADGTITYAPARDYAGSDSLSYTVSDGHGGAASATLILTVAPVNDPPVTAADTVETPWDLAVTVDVLANDVDPEGGTLRVVSVGQPASGTASVTPDGKVAYGAASNFVGEDTFTYAAADDQGGRSEGRVTVAVGPAPLRIVSIAMTTAKAGGGTYAIAALVVADRLGRPAGGAAVAGRWSGAATDTDAGITGGYGEVTVRSDAVRKPLAPFTFTVSSVAKASYSWDVTGSIVSGTTNLR